MDNVIYYNDYNKITMILNRSMDVLKIKGYPIEKSYEQVDLEKPIINNFKTEKKINNYCKPNEINNILPKNLIDTKNKVLEPIIKPKEKNFVNNKSKEVKKHTSHIHHKFNNMK